MSAALRLVRDTDGGDELPPLVAWEIYLRGAGRSERTIGEGVATVQRLERHAGRPCDQLAAIDVSRFLAQPRFAARSRAAYFGSISAFFKWYGAHGGADITAGLPYPRSPKGTPRPITGADLRTLLALRMNHRTRAMILLAALAGLRVHEIAKVRGEDIDTEGRTLRVTGKGGRTDTVPLHPLLAELAATMPRRGWWFPGNARRPGEHVRSKSVTDIIAGAMRRADVAGTPHSLRHW